MTDSAKTTITTTSESADSLIVKALKGLGIIVLAPLLLLGPLLLLFFAMIGIGGSMLSSSADIGTLTPHIVRSNQMCPTLVLGDVLIADSGHYSMHPPERDETVVFKRDRFPNREQFGRILGLPGDRIAIDSGRVTRNGEPLDEPYINLADGVFKGASRPTFTVRPGHLYIVSDNRGHFLDGRFLGQVPIDHLVGKLKFIYGPRHLSRFGMNLQRVYPKTDARIRYATASCSGSSTARHKP